MQIKSSGKSLLKNILTITPRQLFEFLLKLIDFFKKFQSFFTTSNAKRKLGFNRKHELRHNRHVHKSSNNKMRHSTSKKYAKNHIFKLPSLFSFAMMLLTLTQCK